MKRHRCKEDKHEFKIAVNASVFYYGRKSSFGWVKLFHNNFHQKKDLHLNHVWLITNVEMVQRC